ncbi:MAG: quinol:electron acceptor oxidoreductase subunit ActD, partial [Bacteroidia bacterium]
APFVYSAFGLLSVTTKLSLLYGVVGPRDSGGKPCLPFSDDVPISGEMTVLFAAHGTILTFFVVSEYYPGKKAVLMDERQTDDVFVIAINEADVDTKMVDDVNRIMTGAGAYEITTKEV